MAKGGWVDIDAPDTNWRPSSEDPLPLFFGRAGWLGFLYRLISCRPLDGHARTDAGFLRAGTKAYTKSGHTLAFNFWPGWKRGLLVTRMPAFLLLLILVWGEVEVSLVSHYLLPAAWSVISWCWETLISTLSLPRYLP
jgi:hypothetical protein